MKNKIPICWNNHTNTSHYSEFLSFSDFVLQPISTSNYTVIPQICHYQYLQPLHTFQFQVPSIFLVHFLWYPESKNSSIPLGPTKHWSTMLSVIFVSLRPSLASLNYGQSLHNHSSFPPSPHHGHLEKSQSWLNSTVCWIYLDPCS